MQQNFFINQITSQMFLAKPLLNKKVDFSRLDRYV